MPTKRLLMRQLREILRLKLQADLSIRQIHRSLRVSVGAVSKVLSKANEMNLSWPDVNQLDDVQLASRFYPEADTRQSGQYEMPDWRDVHQELTHKGVTKHLLWEEYTEQYPVVTVIRNIAIIIRSGRSYSAARCGRLTRPVKNCLWIMPGKPYR